MTDPDSIAKYQQGPAVSDSMKWCNAVGGSTVGAKMKTILYFFFIGILGAPSVQARQSVGKIRIGMILPLTGSMKAYGEEAQAAAKIGVAAFIQKAPKFANRIELVMVDNESNLLNSKAIEKLWQKRVDIVLGGLFPRTEKALHLEAAARNIPLIVVGAGDHELTPNNWTIRSDMSAQLRGLILGYYATSVLGHRAGALVPSDDSFSSGFISGFKESFSGVGRQLMISELQVAADTGDGRDFILITHLTKKIAGQLEELTKRRRSGREALIVGDGWSNLTGRLITKFDVFFVSEFDRKSDDAEVRSFVDRFVSELRRYPSQVAASSFSAVSLAASAFSEAGTTLPATLLGKLRNLDGVDGLTGRISVIEGQVWHPGVVKQVRYSSEAKELDADSVATIDPLKVFGSDLAKKVAPKLL